MQLWHMSVVHYYERRHIIICSIVHNYWKTDLENILNRGHYGNITSPFPLSLKHLRIYIPMQVEPEP